MDFSLTVLERVRRHGIGPRPVSFAVERLHYYAILGILSETGQPVIVRAVPVTRDSHPRRVRQLIIAPETKPRTHGSLKREDNALRASDGALSTSLKSTIVSITRPQIGSSQRDDRVLK